MNMVGTKIHDVLFTIANPDIPCPDVHPPPVFDPIKIIIPPANNKILSMLLFPL
jgi:hypothetical protein